MARLARAVAVGVAHHVTQRGNRRQATFFCDGDYRAYLELLAEWGRRHGVEVWAYCLMPNHVHLIAVPTTEDGLRRAIGEAHRRYTRLINFREGWRGHLWQGRFASYMMDDAHLMMAARYIELNPVRAGLAASAGDWRWSSAGAHFRGEDDGLVTVRPLLDKAIVSWGDFLAMAVPISEIEYFRRHERTGRPLGDKEFVSGLEERLDRELSPRKAGRKVKDG